MKGKNPTFNELEASLMWNLWMGPKCTGINERTEHPTQKPLWLFERAVLISSNPGDIVLDPFAGAGTAGEAAWKHNRKSVLIEKEEAYIKLIKTRVALLERDNESGDEKAER